MAKHIGRAQRARKISTCCQPAHHHQKREEGPKEHLLAVGTSAEVALIKAIMTVKMETAVTLSKIPRILSVIFVRSGPMIWDRAVIS